MGIANCFRKYDGRYPKPHTPTKEELKKAGDIINTIFWVLLVIIFIYILTR